MFHSQGLWIIWWSTQWIGNHQSDERWFPEPSNVAKSNGGWLRNPATWDGWNPVNDGINDLSTGVAFFHPLSVSMEAWRFPCVEEGKLLLTIPGSRRHRSSHRKILQEWSWNIRHWYQCNVKTSNDAGLKQFMITVSLIFIDLSIQYLAPRGK